MKAHVLKTWPDFFAAIWDGRKTFEVRKNDRNFEEGDLLVLLEWDPTTHAFTQAEPIVRRVTYVLPLDSYGAPGTVAMSLGAST